MEPDAALFAQVFGAQSFNLYPLPKGEALIQSVTEALIAAAVVVLVSRWQCNPFASLSGRQYLNWGE